MSRSSSQHGVGLIEVLVAVLLLSIAVLGFSALQVRAVSATDEKLGAYQVFDLGTQLDRSDACLS